MQEALYINYGDKHDFSCLLYKTWNEKIAMIAFQKSQQQQYLQSEQYINNARSFKAGLCC